MSPALNRTHDREQKSWIAAANAPDAEFPLQNLPHGVFSFEGGKPRGGVAIGDQILDIAAALDAGLFSGTIAEIAADAAAPSLNRLLARGNSDASLLRGEIFDLLSADTAIGSKAAAMADRILVPLAEARLHLPTQVGSFTDFMTSTYHVSAARRSRPARELNENFLHLPVAYNGRASSVVEDGVDFLRPWGQRKQGDGEIVFAPTESLDFEVEFAAVIGKPNALGEPITIDQADEHIFGYVLMNDWSARDIQFWEMRLGPFLGKAFCTTISPWIVTNEAMLPFRQPAPPRLPGQPRPLPYLTSERHEQMGALQVSLWGDLETQVMRDQGIAAQRVVTTQLMHCSWTLPQMVTHHASGGCNLRPGDLLSTGTVSGADEEAAACMFEITAGTLPIDLESGEQRNWLEDLDRFVIGARAEREGFASIGFGRCGATVLPAKSLAI